MSDEKIYILAALIIMITLFICMDRYHQREINLKLKKLEIRGSYE